MEQTGLIVVLAHAGATCFLAGLIWTIQTVHYPLFARVEQGAWPAYSRDHMRRITLLVGPAMLLELALAVWLVFDAAAPAGPMEWRWAGLAALASIWLSTACVQGPMHVRLSRSFRPAIHQALVTTNWVRTALWTARAVLSLLMIAEGAQ